MTTDTTIAPGYTIDVKFPGYYDAQIGMGVACSEFVSGETFDCFK